MTVVREEAFARRVARLPHLGVGISTEFGAGREGLDVSALRASRPDLVQFLEVGCDLARGLDEDTRAWVLRGDPTTYHFLDVNLEEPEDLDPRWMEDTRSLAEEIGAAWLCGDAGLWHVGPRDRAHGTLMPPVLEPDSASEMASAVRRLRATTGFEVLPENPPAHVFPGRLHLLDYFAQVAEEADCGLLLDVAHLAIYQQAMGHDPLDGLERLPLDRVVEIHVAGGSTFEHEGRCFVDDDHGVDVLPATWELLGAILPDAVHLRAVVLECERNPQERAVPLFERLHGALEGWTR